MCQCEDRPCCGCDQDTYSPFDVDPNEWRQYNVSGCVYNKTIKQRTAINELETELYDLMASVEADKVNGGNDADPRIERIGNILTLLEVFHWEDYKRIVIAKFNVPADHFED